MQATGLSSTLRLLPQSWVAAARAFAAELRDAGHDPGQLLVVGTPEEEPWHLTAHLEQTARFGGVPALEPVLVRRAVPLGAPAHLSVGLDAVHAAGRRTTVLVATPGTADVPLLERLDDARRRGAVVLAVAQPTDDLLSCTHAALDVPSAPGQDGFDLATHVVAAPSLPRQRRPVLPPWRR